MPFITEIINKINQNIQSDVQIKDFKCKFLGLATLVERSGDNPQSAPYVIDGKANEQAVMDDNYDLVIYHRITEVSYNERQGFGQFDDETETATVRMVIWANPRALHTSRENLLQVLSAKIPQAITPFNDNIYSILIRNRGLLIDSKNLYSQEYQGVEYRLDPEHLFAGVTYSIETDYNKQCLTICEPCITI